jgi:hypothetical protein
MLQLKWKAATVFFLAAIAMGWPDSTAARAAGDSAPPDSGVLVILSQGRKVGTERFKIASSASGVEATGELDVEMPGSPKTSETSTLKLDPKLRPLSYVRQQRSPKKGSVNVDFGSPETTVTTSVEGANDERIFYLAADRLAVLDTNFFHHYALLVRQYDSIKNGSQLFNVFVPQEATPATISLEFVAVESVTVGKTARKLNHFAAQTDETKIDLWAGPDGEIYRMSIPQANLEILRQ